MRRYIFIASALLLCATASAQNLNPTVQVTNAYEGKIMEVAKQEVPMAVPDSLLKFDWNFDYSVFDNPYKGAYEFKPYYIDMKPEPSRYDGSSLYVRAGAGYSLHPEALVVWTPKIEGRFGVTVYDDFRGFWGNYHDVTGISTGTEDSYLIGPSGKYSGMDMTNKFGVGARYDAPWAIITLDAGLGWLKTQEKTWAGNNALSPSATLRVRSNAPSPLSYDASLRYTFTHNSISEPVTPYKVNESNVGTDISAGYRIADNHSVQLAVNYDHFAFGEPEGVCHANLLNVAPSYRFTYGRISAMAGVKFSHSWKNYSLEQAYVNKYMNADGVIDYPLADYRGRKFYPNVSISYEAVDDLLVISANVTGGQRYNSYASRLDANHHLPLYCTKLYSKMGTLIQVLPEGASVTFGGLGDSTANTIDASLGVSGRYRSMLQYKLNAGYARYYNTPLEGLARVADSFVYTISMSNYHVVYAELNSSWRSDRIDASGRFRVQKSYLEAVSTAISSPRFLGSADVAYNWNRRIFAGLSAEWLSGRKYAAGYEFSIDHSFSCDIPGWVDLGVNLEFKATNKLSFWLKGSNLLNATVMRNFMFSEAGPWFTAGICLNI